MQTNICCCYRWSTHTEQDLTFSLDSGPTLLLVIQGVSERRYHFYRSICKKTIDARNMKFSANYWYRPHDTLVPISRLYVHFLLNSKLKYEFRSYFQQWPLANKAMPPLIRKRYLTTLLLILSP